MARKKMITKENLCSMYMDHVLSKGEAPKNVYIFSKENNFEESLFYQHFGSFEAVENSLFAAFFDNTKALLEGNGDYAGFDNRNKLLSFYFTFFENLTANRSFILTVLARHKDQLKTLPLFSELGRKFKAYIRSLAITPVLSGDKNIDKIQEKAVEESAWLQLLITMKFWANDSSPSFERTDIFIEKAVNTSFDLLENIPLRSVIDLGKFLVKEKFNMSM